MDRICTPSGWIRWTCGAAWGWCSSAPILSHHVDLRQRGGGLKLNGVHGDFPALVENSLRQAALWDEVKIACARARSRSRAASSSAVHRARSGGGTGGAADGRAGQRARSIATARIEE